MENKNDPKSKNFTVVGIDPNQAFLAIGVLRSDNHLIACGTIDHKEAVKYLDKIMTSTGAVEICVEGFKCYGKVVGKSSFDTIEAIGRLEMYCELRGYKFRKIDKPTINKYLSGRGSTKKNDIGQIVMWYLGLKKKITPVHVSDSVAVAICSKNLVMQERCR